MVLTSTSTPEPSTTTISGLTILSLTRFSTPVQEIRMSLSDISATRFSASRVISWCGQLFSLNILESGIPTSLPAPIITVLLEERSILFAPRSLIIPVGVGEAYGEFCVKPSTSFELGTRFSNRSMSIWVGSGSCKTTPDRKSTRLNSSH